LIEDNDGTKLSTVSNIVSLVKKSIIFSTLEDMKNTTLSEGDVVETLGYNTINDGGRAKYVIVYAPTDVDDGIFTHYLNTSDTLRAHLITGQSINVLQAGAKGDGVSNDYTVIQKCLNSGYNVEFPTREYLISGHLSIPSNSVIDFNGSTIICETSSCISLGINDTNSNITIRNATFESYYCGIEVWSWAKDIRIENCNFKPIGTGNLSKGISISGAFNITITDCNIGYSDKVVNYGIYLSSGTQGSTLVGNSNILISNNSIIAKESCIYSGSPITDKNITISNNILEGYGNVRSEVTAVGVQVVSNSDAFVISTCLLSNLATGVTISGAITANLSISDITCSDVNVMYSFMGYNSSVQLSGMQRFTGSTLTGNDYIFDRLTSKLILNTVFDLSDATLSKTIVQAKTSIDGKLVDSIYPVNKAHITVASLSDLNSTELTNAIPAYANVALDLNFSGNISEIKFPSLKGQVVALYSSQAVLVNSSTIRIGSDSVALNQYIPVVLKNMNGVWYRVG
jgi:hypothetical protein